MTMARRVVDLRLRLQRGTDLEIARVRLLHTFCFARGCFYVLIPQTQEGREAE